jgi:cold shock CspA family protein
MRTLSKYLTGRVVYFNRAKAFGFIVADGSGIRCFFHRTNQTNQSEWLSDNDKVSFDTIEDGQGRIKAVNVERI